MRVSVVPHPSQHLLLSVFFILTVFMGDGSSSLCFSLYFLMINDVEYLLIYLLAIHKSYSINYPFKSFEHSKKRIAF